MKYLIAAMLMVLSAHALADDFAVARGWKLSVDGGLAVSSFSDSDTQTYCDDIVKYMVSPTGGNWDTAKASYVNTPGVGNVGIFIGYDFGFLQGPDFDGSGWSTTLGAGYRYYGGPESVITYQTSSAGGWHSKGIDDITTDVNSFYVFSQPTFHLNQHHAIFVRIEAGISEMDYVDNFTLYNNANANPNSLLNEASQGYGEHVAALIGYQFTPWKHFAFNVSAGLHADYISNITIQSISASNYTTNDKVGDTLLGNDGQPLTEPFIGAQSNISASFIW